MLAVEAMAEGGFVHIRARDFDGTRRVDLDSVPRSATVGEVVQECVRALQLPFESFYHALFRGRELPHADTLAEVGLRGGEEAELELVPEVSAG
jgi:hypothetical protein